jgi:hypothetical protein
LENHLEGVASRIPNPIKAGTEHNPLLRRYLLRINLKILALYIDFTDFYRSIVLAIIISGRRQ